MKNKMQEQEIFEIEFLLRNEIMDFVPLLHFACFALLYLALHSGWNPQTKISGWSKNLHACKMVNFGARWLIFCMQA